MSEDWRERAACKNMDPAIFFPDRGGDFWSAIAVCETCPVRLDCLDYALDHPELVGVWGGMSDRKRTKLRRSLNAPRRQWDKPSTAGRDADAEEAISGLVMMLEKLASA